MEFARASRSSGGTTANVFAMGTADTALVTLAEGRATPRPDDIRGKFAI